MSDLRDALGFDPGSTFSVFLGCSTFTFVVVGLVVFGIGSYYEWLADGQLQSFLANKADNKNRYVDTGVWTHSRHLNYFGNTCVWWGIWLVAVSGNVDDNRLGKRAEYQLLMARTRRFLPIPLPRRTRG